MAHLQAVQTTLQPQQNAYTQLTTYFDPHHQLAWGYMHAEPRPCFTPTLLRELLAWGNGMAGMIDDPDQPDVKYFVLASKVVGGTPVEETIAYAAVSAGRKLDVKAIATLTQSGMTALLVSRLSVDLPIYAMSPLVETRRKVTLFRGVYPVPFEQTSTDPTQVLYLAQDALKDLGAVRDGDYIVITIGEPLGKSGGTNSMKIVKVGPSRKA